MLRVTVGLSRKLTENFNSTGVSVSLEGEVAAPPDDPEAVLARVAAFYDLAAEALADRVAAVTGEPPLPPTPARRDAPPARNGDARNGHHAGDGFDRPDRRGTRPRHDTPAGSRNRSGSRPNSSDGGDEPATEKQVEFLITLGKRAGLTGRRLQERIEDVTARPGGTHGVGPHDLTKREAGEVIDALNDRE